MSANSVLDSFITTYTAPPGRIYQYPALIRHKGTVISFAMDNQRKIYYSLLSLGSSSGDWSERPTELIFPAEIARVGFGVADQEILPVFKQNSPSPEPAGTLLPTFKSEDARTYDYFRSTTARLTADAPFQALSDGKYVYVFRQANATAVTESDQTALAGMDGTLLLDRFLLVGQELRGKLEVRYQRSRSKTRPLNRKDTLGAKDLDGNSFYEPTQQLGFIGDVKEGRFAVLLVPTKVANLSRWQIFTHSAKTGLIHSFNIERSTDGLFNTRGSESYRYTEHPYAGTALNLSANSYVRLGAGAAFSDSAFSQEAWICPNATNSTDTQALFTSKGDQSDSLVASRKDPNASPSIWIIGNSKLRLGLGDGAKWYEYTSPEVLAANAWNHIAVTFDGKTCCLYVNGKLLKDQPVQWDTYKNGVKQPAAEAISGKRPTGTQPTFFGARINGFTGIIEEVRFWNRARTQTELEADLHRQLTGLEPGLIGYWRFDEGSGDTIHDLSDSRSNGMLSNNPPAWTSSMAPVGETASLTRDIFRFNGREVASGLTALLYYRQAKSGSGYSGEEKHFKQNARVLLAVATSARSDSAAAAGDKPYIAALDFGLSNTGKLAEIPDVISLAPINADQQSGQSLNASLDRVGQLQTDIRSLEQQIAPLREAVASLNDKIIDSNNKISSYETQIKNLEEALKTETGDRADRIRSRLEAMVKQRDDERKLLTGYKNDLTAKQNQLAPLEVTLANKENERAPLANLLSGGQQAPMQLIHLDSSGLTVTGGLLNFAWTNDPPRLFDSATGSLALYFHGADDQFFVAYYQTFNESAPVPLRDKDSIPVVSVAARSSDLPTDPFTVSIQGQAEETCTVTVTSGSIVETWTEVPRDPQWFQERLNGLQGSRLIVAMLPSDADANLPVPSTPVANRTVNLSAQPCRWTAAVPGTTLSFVGLNSYAGTSDSARVSATDLPGDLTIEAWLRPSRQTDWARDGQAPDAYYILKHRSQDSDYTLGVQRQLVLSALQFDGATSYVRIPNSNLLNFSGAITIEAWIKPSASGGLRNIVAHGPPLFSQDELFLRLGGTTAAPLYEFGSSSDTNHLVSMPVPAGDANGSQWIHLVGVYDPDAKSWTIYRNGVEGKKYVEPQSGTPQLPPLPGIKLTAGWGIGGKANALSAADARLFKGAIDDVRIWKRARTPEEIKADMYRRLNGNETGLVGYWHFEGGAAKDYSRYRNHGELVRFTLLTSMPKTVASPLFAYSAFAGVNGKVVAAKDGQFASESWNHLAAVLHISHALRFDGQENYLEAGNSEPLNINGDLTLEAFLQPDDVSGYHGIVTRGNLAGDSDNRTPYSLAIQNGKLHFSFQDTSGNVHTFTSTAALEQDKTYRIAVTRKTDKTKTAQDQNQNSVTFGWGEITFYLDGKGEEPQLYLYDNKNISSTKREQIKKALSPNASANAVSTAIAGLAAPALPNNYLAPSIGRSSAGVEIGRAYDGGEARPFKGAISQVRVWNVALGPDQVLQQSPGKASGLVAWWSFGEGQGDQVADVVGRNNARIKGAPEWRNDPDLSSWSLQLYRNGERLSLKTTEDLVLPQGDSQFTLGACLVGGAPQGPFQGELEEVRAWNVARTQQQIRDNLFGRLHGEFEDLVAYYTFDANPADPQGTTELQDQSPLGNNLSIHNAGYIYSTAPIGQDTPQVRSALAGIRTPFNSWIESQPDAQEYGEMQVDSRGNLIGAFKRCYSYILNGRWHLITGFKVGDMYTEWVGQAQFAPQLFGFIEGAPPVPGENLTIRDPLFGSPVDYTDASSVRFVQADRTTAMYAASRDHGFDMSIEGFFGLGAKDRTDLFLGAVIRSTVAYENYVGIRGLVEFSMGWLEDASAAVGREKTRTISMALRGSWENPDVKSSSGDDEDVGRRFLPDNTGMALVQSQTADIFALRLKSNHALITYQMRPNPDIPPDWNIITFPINPTYTKQGTLDGKLGLKADQHYPNALEAYSSDSSYFKPHQAYALKKQIQDEEARLRADYEAFEAGKIGRDEQLDPSGKRIAGVTDESDWVSPGSTFGLAEQATNQQVLQDRVNGLAKRNLANTYVWTADGGLFAETEQTMDAMEEQAGGSYSFKDLTGLTASMKVQAGPVLLIGELNALFGGHIDVTVTKSLSSETSFELEVELPKVEPDIFTRIFKEDGSSTFMLDEKGNLIKKPGKVDAYRFMTFFLAPKNEYHDLFFDTVVDPDWLQGNEPGAGALRQARDDTRRPACWRIMHRVTYVSRIPAPLDRTALEKEMHALDIDSNYELIKALEPYVITKRDSYAAFNQAIDRALEQFLPGLVPHAAEIKRFLCLYYDVPEGLVSAPARDEPAPRPDTGYGPEPDPDGGGEIKTQPSPDLTTHKTANAIRVRKDSSIRTDNDLQDPQVVGTGLTVIARNADNTWVQIKRPPATATPGLGWVQREFMSITDDLSTLPINNGAVTGVTATADNQPGQPVIGRNKDSTYVLVERQSTLQWWGVGVAKLKGNINDLPIISADAKPSLKSLTGKVKPDLNIYQSPGSASASLGSLHLTQEVTVLGPNADCTWFKVKLADGKIGWTKAIYLTVSAEMQRMSVVTS